MADNTPVAFNRDSADLIGRVVKEFRGQGRGELPLPKRRRVVSSSEPAAASGAAKFGVTEGIGDAHAIIGTTGTAGSCTVRIWRLNGDGSTEQTETTETWYNLSTTGEIPTGAVVQAKEIDGLMVIDVQDCAPSLVEE